VKTTFLLFCSVLLNFSVEAQTTTPADTTRSWQIHGENTVLINQSSFVNWAAGGENTVAGNLLLNYDFNYNKKKWLWYNKVILGYGLTKQSNYGWRKTDDRLILNSILGYQASKYWVYTFYSNFLTQLSNGYKYDGNNRSLISGFLAPAVLTLGPGLAYYKSDKFIINVSPLASRFTFVEKDELSKFGDFGVKPGKKYLYEFGASFYTYYKFNIMENVSLENILRFYSNYLNKPQNIYTDYMANLLMKVNKFITVNAGIQIISDANSQLLIQQDGTIENNSNLQLKQYFGVGLNYKF